MKLTDISLRQLPLPAKGQRTYFDGTLPSFGCRISQGGTRSFVVQHGADRQIITIGRFPIISLSEARNEAKRILAERTLGKHRPRSIAYDEAEKLFLAACAQRLRPRTVVDYTRFLRSHFRFRRRQLSDIAPQDITVRIDRLASTPCEQNHALVVAKIFFRWAARRHYIERSPCEGMQPPSRLMPRERVLSDEELAVIYRNSLNSNEIFSRIVALLILTGQRRGEIAALQWGWINSNERTITLPSSLTKNKRNHTFPYGEAVAEILKTIPNQGDYLFPASRAHVNGKPTTIFNGFTKCKIAFDKQAGIGDYHLHDLRRTFATGLAALGTPIHVTERILNHISGTYGGIVSVYQRHNYMNEMRDTVEKWEKRLNALIAQHRLAA